MDKTQQENEERVAEEYLSSLSDLNCNSKPLINMLTMLAEENIEYAAVIVKVVEQHISKVPPDIKLPLLYLIDSIVKNVKSTYVQLFSQCIVNIFCNVFEKVNEKIRERMYALRQTWNEVFSPQKLYALDVKVKRIDNNWPITAKQPQPSIHVNPNFLKTVGAVRSGDVEEILHAKTMELLELRKRKLELELEATKKHLEEQEKQLSKTTDGVIPPVKGLVEASTLPGMRVPAVAPQIVPGIVAPGLLPAHHMNAGASAGVVPGAMGPGLYHHSFRNPRPHSQAHVAANMMPIPSQNYPPVTAVNKPKVHPVNPILLNTVRHRDPRLARQQQLQVPSNRNVQMRSERNDSSPPDESKVEGNQKSVSSFRNRSSKNSRSYSGSADGSSVLEGKSTGRHANNSSNFSEQVSKNNPSRDKDKDRKRSESKSSTTSSSSVGSSSSERRKGSSVNRNKKSAEKCDKDAFEIAPLPTAFKRKSLSPSSSPTKKKDFKRMNKSHIHRSRSRSPSDVSTKDVDLRPRNSPPVSPKKHRKSSVSDSEPEEEDQNATKTTKGLENKNIKIVLEPMPVVAKTDIDLRRLPSSYSPIPKVVAPTTTCETTVATSSPKVSFKIQKLFNKLDKSTEHPATAFVNVETSKVSRPSLAEADSDERELIVGSSGRPAKETTERMIEDYNDDKKRTLPISDGEEPLAKKSKSAKLDALFGDEDVDLRTVMPPQILATQQQHTISVSPPPPPVITEVQEQSGDNWSNLKATSSNVTNLLSPKKSASLEDVRAKLAKATKYNKFGKNDKFGKDLSHRFKLGDLNMNEDSQEANDEKIRTIIAQAQELLETKSINQDQYKNLMQKVMSINESSKLKEAKRRESLTNAFRIKQPSDTEAISSSVDSERLAAREAILKKRIPKLPRGLQTVGENLISEPNVSVSNNTNSPVYNDRNNLIDSDVVIKTKPSKEKRSKPSKWGERVDSAHVNASAISILANSQKGWLKGSAIKQHSGSGFRGMLPMPQLSIPNIQQPPQLPWQIGPNVASSPFINTMSIARGNVTAPPNVVVPTIPKPCNSIDNPQADLVRTITIDGLSKEIRIYDQVAIVFMELDQPREIGFQVGQRSIIIDNEEPITLQFNDDYKVFPINGEAHRLRFGFPSRELYIEEHWYEIYFGGPPVSIPIQNKMHILKAEGPPPQVNIGALRRDLVVGKINMIVDAHIVIPLFLDAKIQTFRLGENEHTVQFADNLLTVLLDGEDVKVEFGGLPKSYTLRGRVYFIRFGALPQGVVAGNIRIKDMLFVKTEPVTEYVSADGSATHVSTADSSLQSPAGSESLSTKQPQQEVEQTISEGQATPSVTVGIATDAPSIPIIPPAALNNINIDELFQKLVSSGILGGTNGAANKAVGVPPSTSTAALPPEENSPPVPAARPIDLSKSETVKTRQAAVVNTLFSGMQCSSCGVRFPPEQTIKYSQHLDWHFRQNRRERDSSRKAHSRKWYYDLADWVQYEEIEDLEEREKNFFETQLNDVDTNDDTSNQRWTNSPVLSCPALPQDVDRACDMCHEKFEQFYNEELEEWHLRSAIRVDEKIYHPLCYDDFKASLNPVKSPAKVADVIVGDDANAVIKIEGDDKTEESTSLEVKDNDDDDDVIVLPNEEPSVTEIDDDDEYVPINVTREEMGVTVADEKSEEGGLTDTAGSDVEIQEPHIPFTDLDTYEEKPLSDGDESSQMSFRNVKIKEEPKDDDDDEDDGFEDVGTVLIVPEEEISIQSSEDTQTQTIASSVSTASPAADRPPSTTSLVQLDASEFSEVTNVEHSTSMDGNLGAEDEHNLSSVGSAPAIPLASYVNKIKINIAKNSASSNHSHSSNSTSTLAASATTITTNTSTAPNTIPGVNYALNEASDQNLGTSAITVVSTIPVLCGGGTVGARTTIATSSSGASTVANDATNVSTISVIGSYGSTPNNSRHYMETVAVAPAPAPRTRTPPIEDTITYEVKPSLKKATLTKAKKVKCGIETSGLCSVM